MLPTTGYKAILTISPYVGGQINKVEKIKTGDIKKKQSCFRTNITLNFERLSLSCCICLRLGVTKEYLVFWICYKLFGYVINF